MWKTKLTVLLTNAYRAPVWVQGAAVVLIMPYFKVVSQKAKISLIFQIILGNRRFAPSENEWGTRAELLNIKVPGHLERISQEGAWDKEFRQVQETPTVHLFPQKEGGGEKGLRGKAGREDWSKTYTGMADKVGEMRAVCTLPTAAEGLLSRGQGATSGDGAQRQRTNQRDFCAHLCKARQWALSWALPHHRKALPCFVARCVPIQLTSIGLADFVPLGAHQQLNRANAVIKSRALEKH